MTLLPEEIELRLELCLQSYHDMREIHANPKEDANTSRRYKRNRAALEAAILAHMEPR